MATKNSVPDFSFLQGLVDRDENGYILQKDRTMTNVDGIFAAGQGCAAALECERWLAARGVH